MPYVPPNGSAVELDLQGEYQAPVGAALNLEFDPVTVADIRQASVATTGARVGTPALAQSTFAKLRGADTSAFGRVRVEKDTPKIKPAGINSSIVVGTPEYVRWPRWIEPPSMAVPTWPLGTLRVRLLGGYNPPPADSLVLNWFAEPYAPPPASSLQLDFGALGYGYVWPAMGDVSAFGSPTVAMPVGLRPAGIAAPALGVPRIQTSTNELRVSGFLATEWGSPNLQNKGVALKPGGIAPGAFGTSYIWNLLQFLGAKGFDGLKIGEAFVSGSIKIVSLQGLADSHVSAPLVVNTTADQTAALSGIQPPAVAAPRVSPRMLYAQGVPTPGLGVPTAQFPPRPAGFESSRYGRPAIEYKTKLLVLPGIEAIELGFPRVFDPTRKVYPPSAPQVGIFGDTRIANRDVFVRPAGVDSLEVPIWARLENTRRPIYPSGSTLSMFGATAIDNATPSFAPAGWDAFAGLVGVDVGYVVRQVRPGGFYSTPFGLPVLAQPPSLVPEGIAGEMGEPSVWPRVRWVEAAGATAALFGEATVWFRSRTLAAEGSDAQIHGTAMVAHARRWLLARGAQFSSEGVPAISNADRTIAPASIFERFATGHAMGWARTLRPVGFDATRFGVRIIPERQSAYPIGFSGRYGLAAVFNARKLVRPAGITTTVQPEERWGAARAWNLRQYVTMTFDPDSRLNPPAWPLWTKIERRNRVIRAIGHAAVRFGDAQIDNAARPLLAEGVAAPSQPAAYQSGMVAYRVRALALDGIEAPYISGWATAWNDAAVVAPKWQGAAIFGALTVEKTRRYFNRIGGFDAAWFGYPMVAPRVRTLSFDSRYGIAPPIVRLPEVKLHTRYIDGVGYESAGPGWASLSIHWTLITPRWTLQNLLYGSPTVRNVTPELRTRGRAADEYGDALVRLQWRPVAPQGNSVEIFGRSGVAFRDRTVFAQGVRSWVISERHKVEKTGAPPYSLQTITLARFDQYGADDEGFGIQPPRNGTESSQVPRPVINQQVIYVRQNEPATKFGMARITANTIRVEPGYWELLVSAPIVTLKVRTLTVAQFPSSEVFEPGKPRLSPHTIWAVKEAPAQAVVNHNATGLHYINEVPGAERWINGIGNPSVALQHRTINLRFDPDEWRLPGYGNAIVRLGRNYIAPPGFRTFRMGWHEIPGTRTLEQFDSEDAAHYGEPSIDHVVPVGPRTVAAPGLDALNVGEQQIELLNRVVSAQGYEATRMGSAKPGDTPYMWQGLRVGPLMPTIPEGFGADLHGEQWISHRVREVHPAGFDDFRSEYQLEAFEQRMRVTRRAPSTTIVARNLLAAGAHPASVLGTPDIRPGTHFIRPDGNAEQFRKGAF